MLGWAGEHGDLWGLLAAELGTRAHPVTVAWVKGHAKMIDVQRGRTTLADKDGNDGADKLAVAGAEQHAVDSEIVIMSDLRREHGKEVHSMFIAIVKARRVQELRLNQALQALPDDVGDRGSDPGDCMADAAGCFMLNDEVVDRGSDITCDSL